MNAEDTNDYKRYIHRHNERRATGRKADKLVELVGKINPRIEGELRIYVGRFPWKVAPLLAEARKMFCKTTGGTRSGEQRKKTVTEETSSAAKSHKKNKDKKDKKKKQHKKNKTKDKKNKTREDGAPTGKTATTDDHMGDPCTTWRTNWTGGIMTVSRKPLEERTRGMEGTTQKPQRHLWMSTVARGSKKQALPAWGRSDQEHRAAAPAERHCVLAPDGWQYKEYSHI